MYDAFGIVTSSGGDSWVEGIQDYRPIGSFSFLGRYRVIDFPISNLSNSDIDRIQVYIRRKPRTLVAHLGTGRQYNINSKRGDLQLLFSDNSESHSIYNTDIAMFMENLECIQRMHQEYVVIVPSYMVYTANYSTLIQNHIESGADITLLYHSVDNAKEAFLNCDTLNLNRQKGVLSIERNHGNTKEKKIFMDTYIMKKDLFIDLVQKAHKQSSMYTLADIVNDECGELDVRGISHRGYFASIADFKSYYDANMSLIDFKAAMNLFDEDWPIYTRTNNSCPSKYLENASVKSSVISNGCVIKGTVENCILGRGSVIEEGAVVKNCVIFPGAVIGKDVHAENLVVDRRAKVIHVKEVVADPAKPGYIKREDTL